MVEEWTPKEVKEALDRGEKITLLDVREKHELAVCKIEPSVHISMKEIHLKYEDLDQYHPIIVYCRSGQRSHQVCTFLQQKGYSNVYNLSGGVLRWSDDIDPSMPKY